MPVVHANTHAVPVSQLLPLGTGRGEMSTDKDLVSKVFPKQSLLEKFAGEETDAERSTQIVSENPGFKLSKVTTDIVLFTIMHNK